MGVTIQDVLAALGGALNGVSQAILAMGFGFAMVPSALAYGVGIAGCLLFGTTVPVSFQAETIALAGSMGANRRERLSMVMFAGLAMAAIGGLGLVDTIIAFAGSNIIAAMMAGVGIILTKLSFDILRKNVKIGGISFVLAIVIYGLTQSLVYTFVGCILVSSAAARLLHENVEIIGEKSEIEGFYLQKPLFSFAVLRGTLALICLTIGGNIAFGGISAAISGTSENIDFVSIYSGLADALSSLFGGSPISVVIAPTAAAPNPQTSAVILMALMAVILLTKSLPKVARFIASESVAGTLFILGTVVTIPDNLTAAFSGATTGSAIAASVTMAVTAFTDPFIGLVAGIAVSFLAGPLGLG